jgi:hydrogenase maturation protease
VIGWQTEVDSRKPDTGSWTPESISPPSIRVLGLGNVLMSDDGFGPYAARVLDAFYEMPEGVEVIDVGTPGLDLVPYIIDADVLILLDTVAAPGAPGTVYTYTREQILAKPPQPRMSPHDPGVKDALLTVAAVGRGPREVLLIGVVTEWVATGVKLSPRVREAISPVLARALAELQRFGIQPAPRPVPRRPDTWWEREPGETDFDAETTR